MELEKIGLTTEQATQLVRGVADSQYNLLLGAGFSMSAHDLNGKDLPSGPKLSDDINTEFKLGFADPEKWNLQLTFGEARHADKDETRLAKYLRGRFVGCSGTWHAAVLELPWRRIWTLNIDDVLESYVGKGATYEPASLSWESNLVAPSVGSVQVVHLHGRASDLKDNVSPLVFALREYAKAIRNHGDWHSEFWSQWLQKPFLIIGARLVDEIDLSEPISRGTQAKDATGFESVAVSRSISEIDRKRFLRANVLPVSADAASFIGALREDVAAFRAAYAAMTQGAMSAGAIARFNQQFESLSTARAKMEQHHDFYAGDEPNWSDVLEGLDAKRGVTETAHRELIVSPTKSGVRVALLVGDPGAGKSTALLRLAKLSIAEGFRPFRFREEERPDIPAILEWIRANPKTLLLFDNGGDFSGDLERLVRSATAAGLELSIAVADRSKRMEILEPDLATSLVGTYRYEKVSRSDALSILSLRGRSARLGVATAWNDSKQWNYVRNDHAADLFGALAGLEQGVGFYSRLETEWLRATRESTEAQRNVLYAIAVVHRNGYSLPLKVALDVAGRPSGGVDDLRLVAFRELISIDPRGLRFRHRMLAEHVFKRFVPVESKIGVSLAIAHSLAPLLSPTTMRARTYPVLIARSMMDKASVLAIAQSVEAARAWYESLEPDFGWNGRFWDQRALLEADDGHYDRAYSYAKKSVSLHRHAFALNTLGKVRLKASIDDRVSLDQAWEFFREGCVYLQESVAHAKSFGDFHEYPFVTFFEYAMRMAGRLDRGDYRLPELDKLFIDWEKMTQNRTGLISEKIGLAKRAILMRMVDVVK